MIQKGVKNNSIYTNLDIYRVLHFNIQGIHVIANNSTNNNVFFFVSDLKIEYYNNY